MSGPALSARDRANIANLRSAARSKTMNLQGSNFPWSGLRAAIVRSSFSAFSSGTGSVKIFAGRERRVFKKVKASVMRWDVIHTV